MKIPQKIEPKQLFAPPKMKKMDLISRNEKTQVEVSMILISIYAYFVMHKGSSWALQEHSCQENQQEKASETEVLQYLHHSSYSCRFGILKYWIKLIN